MNADSKATLPPSSPASTEGPQRQLLGKKLVINVIAIFAGIIATATVYAVLATIVGMGLGAGIIYQVESARLATGIPLTSSDFMPLFGSAASTLLAVITLSVPAGAIAFGHTAYRSTKRWLAARFAMEG